MIQGTVSDKTPSMRCCRREGDLALKGLFGPVVLQALVVVLT